MLNLYSTLETRSIEIRLRPISAGTSYSPTRLAFHSYTQVRGTHVRSTPSGLHAVLPALHLAQA